MLRRRFAFDRVVDIPSRRVLVGGSHVHFGVLRAYSAPIYAIFEDADEVTCAVVVAWWTRTRL